MNHKALRYLIVGGLAFLIEMASLYGLKNGLHMSPVSAVAVSFWIGLVVGFVLQKYLAFRNHEHRPKTLARQLIAYGILVAVNYVFTLAMAKLLTPHISVFIVRAITMTIIACWNYLFYANLFKAQTENP